MRTLIYFLFFLLSNGLFAQQSCWECLVAARNMDAKMAKETCLEVAKNEELTRDEQNVVSLVIGKLLMNENKYNQALPYLRKAVFSSDPLFRSIVLGLMADCNLDEGQLDQALSNYILAADLADHSFLTPYFIAKQGIVYQNQKNTAEVERIASRLRVNHQYFFLSQGLLAVYGDTPSKYDSLNRTLINQSLPKGPYGIGIVYGQEMKPELFYRYVNQFKYYDSISDPNWFSNPETMNLIYEKSFYTAKNSILIEAKSIPFALSVSEEEFLAYLFAKKGYPLLPDIEMNFKDENGVLDETALMEFYQELESEQNSDWKVTKDELKRGISEEKLIQLLNIGINVSNTEVILEQLRKSTLHQFRCIVFPKSIHDSISLLYSEKDLANYFNVHKSDWNYEYPSVRKVHLLKVPISPTKADSMAFLKTFSELKKPFEKTNDDSLFVETHSDFKVFPSKYKLTYFPESYKGETFGLTFPDALTDEFTTAKKGDVIGPYIHQGTYKMAKVVGFNEQALTVRHILISSIQPTDTAQHEAKRKLANQLLTKINHDNFEEYVVKYSEDPGSVDNGGVYADFMDFEMVEPFANYAATARIGKIGIVETDFGFHIMEVLDRKKVKFPKLMIIQQKLLPSDQLKQQISKQVNELYQSMKLDLERLSPIEKLNYFDSIGKSSNGISLNIIYDSYPVISNKISENAANQLLKACYNPAQKPGELLLPINDDTTWIVPFFENAYSSENYNYNQVFGLLKNTFIGSTKSDLIQAKYSTVKTLQELEATAHLPIITKTIRKDSLDFSDGFLVEFYNFLLSNTPTSNEMLWFKSTSSCVAYEYVSSRKDENVVDLFEIKKGLQSKLEEHANLLEIDYYTKPTIYNYPLFKLGVRK